MVLLLACQQSRSYKSKKETIAKEVIEPVSKEATPATPLNMEVKYSIEQRTLIKKARRGPILKVKYPEIKATTASPTVQVINDSINKEINEITNHYLQIIGNDKGQDTLAYINIEASIWANELVSVRYYINENVSNPDRGSLSISYSHYSLSKGSEILTANIFNSVMPDYWRNWVKNNVKLEDENAKLEDSVWHHVSLYVDGEEFEGTWQELLEQILQQGFYVIEENGDLTYMLVYQANLTLEGTVPYEEIKDCFKITPKS
jgi:hypothetical protein